MFSFRIHEDKICFLDVKLLIGYGHGYTVNLRSPDDRLPNLPRSCSGEPRGCVNRIFLWPLRRDDHSGFLIGVGGTRRSDWTARLLANDVSARIDRQPARDERSIARVQGQVAASCYTFLG